MKIIVAAWLFLTPACQLIADAAKRTSSPSRNEPFYTFERIDGKLSVLAQQQKELAKTILPADGSKATETKPGSRVPPWARGAETVRQSARTIRTLAQTQQLRYRERKQKFGVRAFGALARTAARVEQTALQMKRVQAHAAAAKQHAILDDRILSLVRQYQSITGGYGAARCTAGGRPCCLPKEHENKDEVLACKWVCVRSSAACRKGFTGPAVSNRQRAKRN
jgi:hypothetical protein